MNPNDSLKTDATDRNWNQNRTLNWPAALFLTISPFVAIAAQVWYIRNYGIHLDEVLLFVGMYFITGLGITAGYHRHFAHRSHEAHPILEAFYLICGAAVMQQSALLWARNHRIHHRFADTELDPHNINEGFFHAHMGWIFYDRPLDKDFSTVKDLLQNRLVMWQKKYYWPLFFATGVLLPTLIGWAFGHPLGGFLWGSLFRIVVENHVIYSINSVTHTFGKQCFSLKGEARDSWIVALISNGEGYHSFHHRFAFDYRNGYRWYQWDPSKWFIGACAFLGLAKNLKRASETSIMQARVLTDRQRAREWLAELPVEKQPYWEQKLQEAQNNFESVLARWQDARECFREYKQMRKNQALAYSRAEYANLKIKLSECRRDLRMAQGHWSALLATIALFIR